MARENFLINVPLEASYPSIN